VKLLGRGIIDRPSGVAIQTAFSDGVAIDGIISVGAGEANNGGYTICGGQTSNLSINNFKSFSFRKWTDGIDLCASTNVAINDIFMRNGDDCIALYGSRLSGGPGVYHGDTTAVAVTNAILWADVAHPINIGTHGDPNASGGGNAISGITFTNLDILEQNEPQVDYQGTMAISDGDANLVSNVRFENIRVEQFTLGQLLNLAVLYNTKYNTAPGRGIDGVYFKNISYTGSNTDDSHIVGYDASRVAKNITFDNLRINGSPVLDAGTGNISVGAFTQNIQFVSGVGGVPLITSRPTASGSIGTSFNYTITATNSPTSYSAPGLPAGLSVSMSTGLISGTPTTAATSSVTISATNSGGTGSSPLTLTISGGGVPDGTYSLKNRASGKMLDNAGSTANGAILVQWADGTSNNQKWVISTNGGYRKLMCIAGSKYLDSLGHTADASTVGEWAGSTSPNQDWTVQDLGTGYFKVINRANGKCLDNADASADGAQMQFWGTGSSLNQQWQFVAP
jgi:hypothetical protein